MAKKKWPLKKIHFIEKGDDDKHKESVQCSLVDWEVQELIDSRDKSKPLADILSAQIDEKILEESWLMNKYYFTENKHNFYLRVFPQNTNYKNFSDFKEISSLMENPAMKRYSMLIGYDSKMMIQDFLFNVLRRFFWDKWEIQTRIPDDAFAFFDQLDEYIPILKNILPDYWIWYDHDAFDKATINFKQAIMNEFRMEKDNPLLWLDQHWEIVKFAYEDKDMIKLIWRINHLFKRSFCCLKKKEREEILRQMYQELLPLLLNSPNWKKLKVALRTKNYERAKKLVYSRYFQ